MAGTIETGYAAGTGYSGIQSASVGGKEKTDSSFSDTMAGKFRPAPKDMSLAEYKMYIHDVIKRLYKHPSQKNVDWFIDITDAAYRRMQTDPAYEQKVLEYIARNQAVNFGGGPPKFAFIHIDEDWDKCRAYTMGLQDNCPAKRAAERRRLAAEQAKKARRKKLLKEYLKKRAQAKLLQEKFLKGQLTKRRLEHARLAQYVVLERYDGIAQSGAPDDHFLLRHPLKDFNFYLHVFSFTAAVQFWPCFFP